MCGIIGYRGDFASEDLVEGLRAIKHRGPDDSGTYFNQDVGLGHARLAVIDLSPLGHQPMFNESKDISIVFNGEIYNFQEVRTLLENKYEFISKSDTEVIIHAYEEWGTECLHKLNGMFAFVIYDEKRDLLFGARDRLGEKPLKYYFKDNQFIFSSELKGVISVLQKSPELDPVALDNFLTYQYVPAPRTGYKDIYKLPAGSYFLFQHGKLEIKKYWELKTEVDQSKTYGEWKDIVLAELDRAVKERLIADVPIGCLLSGGADSGAVTAFMAKNSKDKIKTYSVGFDDPRFDETKYARIVADTYGTDHHVFQLTSRSLLENFEKVFEHFDEPFGDNSALPTLLLSREIRKNVTVALAGDGGDENFAGYDRYNIVEFNKLYDLLPRSLRNRVMSPASLLFHKIMQTRLSFRAERFLRTFNQPFPRRYVGYNSLFLTGEKHSLYSTEFRNKVKSNDALSLFEKFYNSELTLLENALRFDVNTYLPEDLLFKTDIASMAHALELRAPFLDYKLMETMAGIPSRFKVKNGVLKSVLKDALLDKGVLPREVLFRRKQGFNIPVTRWFKRELKRVLVERILSTRMFDLFDKARLEAYVATYFSSELNYANEMYALFALSTWLK